MMPDPISFGKLDFNLVTSMKETMGPKKTQIPFHMLLLGDFSGRSNRDQELIGAGLKDLVPIEVDRDNLDTILGKLNVEIGLPLFGDKTPPVKISFSELDDFHPDTIYHRLDVFKALKETRKSLMDPSLFAAMAQDLINNKPKEDAANLRTFTDEPPSDDLLDQIIEQGQADTGKYTTTKPEPQWDSFLSRIVQPHLIPKADPRQEEMIDAVDAAACQLMQMILHNEKFQALEAAWKGIYFLVSRLETNEQLKLSLFDMSKAELAADLTASDDLSPTALFRICVQTAGGTAGAYPWSVIAGNYTFQKQPQDLELLGRLAKIAKSAGTCFISAADDRFMCKKSLDKTPDPDDWYLDGDENIEHCFQALRQLPEAANIGLALPRFLLRLPYGEHTDPIDVFDFEEMPMPPVHEKYLWGNPCFALLLLLGQAFSRQGWQMSPGSVLDIDSLPLHVYKDQGESFLKPCAETLLTQQTAEKILDNGLMPLLSFLNQDKIRLARFQSIADPLTRLAGPWD